MAKENLTKAANITVAAREIDFVTQFGDNWRALAEILGIMRPIRKAAGTKLVSSIATVELEDGAIGEGEEIPYSLATVEPVTFQDLTIKKWAKAVSIEAVEKYGAAVAVQKTDEEFRNQLQTMVMTDFYGFLATGQLTSTKPDFQAAVAQAMGSVVHKFQTMNKDASSIVVFVNTLDAYDYLGAAQMSVQNLFGIQYVQNFLGAQTLILTDKVDKGKVIATPTNNIDLYYVDPADSEFAQLGLQYTVEGETNLIGFHTEGNYGTAVGESYAIMGMKLWAEYLDGIAVVTISE